MDRNELEKIASIFFNKQVPVSQKLKNVLFGALGAVPVGLGGLMLWNILRDRKEKQNEKVKSWFAGTGIGDTQGQL